MSTKTETNTTKRGRPMKPTNKGVYTAVERVAPELKKFTAADIRKKIKKGRIPVNNAINRMVREERAKVVEQVRTGKRGRPQNVYEVV